MITCGMQEKLSGQKLWYCEPGKDISMHIYISIINIYIVDEILARTGVDIGLSLCAFDEIVITTPGYKVY